MNHMCFWIVRFRMLQDSSLRILFRRMWTVIFSYAPCHFSFRALPRFILDLSIYFSLIGVFFFESLFYIFEYFRHYILFMFINLSMVITFLSFLTLQYIFFLSESKTYRSIRS